MKCYWCVDKDEFTIEDHAGRAPSRPSYPLQFRTEDSCRYPWAYRVFHLKLNQISSMVLFGYNCSRLRSNMCEWDLNWRLIRLYYTWIVVTLLSYYVAHRTNQHILTYSTYVSTTISIQTHRNITWTMQAPSNIKKIIEWLHQIKNTGT